VEELFGIQNGPNLQALTVLIAARDVCRMPFAIMGREFVEPGPDTLRGSVDDDGIT
jgi:hypothetical protein